MKKWSLGRSWRSVSVVSLATLALTFLYLYHLGSLNKGLSLIEIQSAHAPLGWHGIYHSPLDLPLKVIRSIVFFLKPDHGQFLSRLPNAMFGITSVISFGGLVYLWHGRRTAILSSILFGVSAWILHVSRLASFDVIYLWGMTVSLFIFALLNKYKSNVFVWYLNLFILGLLLTIPGFIWIDIIIIYFERDLLKDGFNNFKAWWQRLLSLLTLLLWAPLIAVDLGRSGELKHWLGLPQTINFGFHLLKQFVAVIVHVFIRGPEYPMLWLGKAPLLDVFTLALCLIGIYFYLTHWRNARSRLLASLFLISLILIGLGGDDSFSLIVPLAYLMAAMGISYLLFNWFKVFPFNPVARAFGVGLIALAIAISCIYNFRAYFIAWPNNSTTKSIFNQRL